SLERTRFDNRDAPRLLSASATTDDRGEYELRHIPAGEYRLRVEPLRPQREPADAIDVDPASAERALSLADLPQNVRQDFALAQGSTVVVTVVGPDGAALGGALVAPERYVGEFQHTNDAGVAAYFGLQSGPLTITVEHPGFAVSRTICTVAPPGIGA